MAGAGELELEGGMISVLICVCCCSNALASMRGRPVIRSLVRSLRGGPSVRRFARNCRAARTLLCYYYYYYFGADR